MSNEKEKHAGVGRRGDKEMSLKRKRGEIDGKQKKNGKRSKRDIQKNGDEVGEVIMNVDQLAWKKISLENDEFDDFEEIEGIDVESVEKDGNKVLQFKVMCSL
jgi:hypothetical protein